MEIHGSRSEPSELDAAAPSRYVGAVGVRGLPVALGEGLEARLIEFGPGGRSRPHICTSDRLLHVVSGEGVVADQEGPSVVGPGDTVTVPAGEWHWHGGLPHTAAVLLVVERAADVSWNVASRDWPIGYGPPDPTA